MSSVSCDRARTAKSATCVAVGTTTVSGVPPTQVTAGAYWTGDGWTNLSPPAISQLAAMFVVSCAPGFCMAEGSDYQAKDSGNVAVADSWDAAARQWQDVSPDLGVTCHVTNPCGWTTGMSCGSATNCMAKPTGGMLAWNGSAWTKTTPLPGGDTDQFAEAYSCGRSDCLTVGSRPGADGTVPAAQLWNGTSWSFTPAPRLP
jgi:hypothetical protein